MRIINNFYAQIKSKIKKSEDFLNNKINALTLPLPQRRWKRHSLIVRYL